MTLSSNEVPNKHTTPTIREEESRKDPTNATDSSPTDSIEKTKNQIKNEQKRLAKLAKFQAKQAALEAKSAASATSCASAKKTKPSSPSPTTVTSTIQEYVNMTPPGEKKDMSGPFPPTYNPKAVESAWYEWWESQRLFSPNLDNVDKGTYVIPIPPPNVTGSLHLGHALTNSIQDTLIRWNRMQGKTVLYVPGCDHAGIATQVVVEKKLMRERKLTRHQLGREAFIEEIMHWKDEYVPKIYNQIKRLGASYDWSRAKFTMDPSMSEAVNEAFVRLHDEGVIYRANRLVNWCTKLKTALSNLEVENKELTGRTLLSVPDHDPSKKYEFGVLISFAYQVENSNEKIVVATTRLETMLGDTAIAVHPSDTRYTHLHGKYVIHPFNGRRIPIIPDEYPDPLFGTGAVKITPAHDFNDYKVGVRNNLEFINIFTDEGQVNEFGAPFTGLQRFDAREAVLKALKDKGLYVNTEDNAMVLPICERSGNIIEPLMKPQWWVNSKDMAEAAMHAVKSGELEIIPQASEKEWFRWLENIQDWCISRQLWWGHRIPAYYVSIQGQEDSNRQNEQYWVSGTSHQQALERAIARFPSINPQEITLIQDEDVLDTWFSSGLWPFSIMGWPNKTQDMDLFYPNSLLETGWDILFFWVARMVMLGIKLTGKVPFKQVFCHAMVRDAHGRKMSKSLGNVIDPLDVIQGISLQGLHERLLNGNLDPREVERAIQGQKSDFPNGIPECGTDALRFTLLAYTSSGRDINLDILRVDGYRKFCNKLWNATRFALLKLGVEYVPQGSEFTLTGKEGVADLWILSKLNSTIINVNKNLQGMNFMQATNAIYQFWLYELCDVYLEVCKPIIDGHDAVAREACKHVLHLCLEQGLLLLHPFMPFVTEELYQRLPKRITTNATTSSQCNSIMIAPYPSPVEQWDNPKAEADYELLNKITHACRSLLSDYGIKSKASIYLQSKDRVEFFQSQQSILLSLVKGCDSLVILKTSDSPPAGCALGTVSEDVNVHLLVKGMISLEQEISKIDAKIAKTRELLDSWTKKTLAEGFSKVPKDVQELTESKIKGFQAELESLGLARENFIRLCGDS